MASKKGNDNDRYVVPNTERGGWDVVKEDDERASAHTRTKQDAIARGRQIVGNLAPGELRIPNKEGQVIDSDTVPRGNESPRRDTK
jgi:hypothetical protein